MLKNLLKYSLKLAGKLTLQILWRLHKPLVLRNKKLENIHAGETCFIFANGGSLKYYDISKLPNNPSIVCSYSLVDKRIESLNIKYYVTTDSYSLYSFQYNNHPDEKKIQLNKIKQIFADIFKNYRHISTFVNITNFYAKVCRRQNINYYHYFEDKDSYNHDLAGSFSNCRGALDTMLGVAKYLGFSKAVLFGCDYLGSPAMEGHFYSDRKQFSEQNEDHLTQYRSKVKLAAEGIEIIVILPEGVKSPVFEFASYENYFNLKKEHRENRDFIDEKHLDMMRDASKLNQIGMQSDSDKCAQMYQSSLSFFTKNDINNGLEAFENNDLQYAFSATSYRSFIKQERNSVKMIFPENFNKRSQDLPIALHDAAHFYQGKPEAEENELQIFSKYSKPILIPNWRIQDIDTEDDWHRAELLYKLISKGKNEK